MAENVGRIRLSNFGGQDLVSTPWTVDPRDCADSKNVYVERGAIRRRPALRRRYFNELPVYGVAADEPANFTQDAWIWQHKTGGGEGAIYNETFESFALGDIDGVDIWRNISGVATIENQTTLTINGARCIRGIHGAGSSDCLYAGDLANAVTVYDLTWYYKFSTGLDSTWNQIIYGADGDTPATDARWGVKVEFASSTTAKVFVLDANNAALEVATINSATSYKMRVQSEADKVWKFYIDNVLEYTGTTSDNAQPTISGSETKEALHNSGTSITKSVTVPSLTNGLLLVKIGYNLRDFAGNGGTDPFVPSSNFTYPHPGITSVKLDSTDLTLQRRDAVRDFAQVAGTTLNSLGGEWWYLKAPSSGAATLTIALPALTGQADIPVTVGIEYWNNINQTTPLRDDASYFDGGFPAPLALVGPGFHQSPNQPDVMTDMFLYNDQASYTLWTLGTQQNGAVAQWSASQDGSSSGATLKQVASHLNARGSWGKQALRYGWGASANFDGHHEYFAMWMYLVPAAASASTQPTDRLLLYSQDTTGPDNTGAWDDFAIGSLFTTAEDTAILVIQGGQNNTAPRLIKGKAFDRSTDWTVVGDLADSANAQVFPVPFQDLYIFPLVPAVDTPKKLNTSLAISDVGGTPENFADCVGFNNILFNCIADGKLQFSGIGTAESYLASDTINIGNYKWTPSAVWPMTDFLFVGTEAGLFAVRGYGRQTVRVDPIDWSLAVGDFHSVSGTQNRAFFMAHSAGRRMTSIPGLNPYRGVYELRRDGSIQHISRKIDVGSLFQSINTWTGRRTEVRLSYDQTWDRLYVLAPRHLPLSDAASLNTGKETWVRTSNGGWHRWEFPDELHLSYIYPHGLGFVNSFPPHSPQTLVGGTGEDGYRYIYYFDEAYDLAQSGVPRGVYNKDTDDSGLATNDIEAYWQTAPLRIFSEDQSDEVQWVWLFGRGGNDAVKVEFDPNESGVFTEAGGTGTLWPLRPEGVKVPIGRTCRVLTLKFTFDPDSFSPEISGFVIGYTPIGHAPSATPS